MNEIQKAIIDSIKNSFMGYEGNGTRQIKLEGIYNNLPALPKDDIRKAIAEWEGVEIVGNSLDGIIEIPAKYFGE